MGKINNVTLDKCAKNQQMNTCNNGKNDGALKVFTRNTLILAEFDSMIEKSMSTNTRSSLHENTG